MTRHNRWSWWPHLVCLLPIILFLVLTVSEVRLPLLLLPVAVLLCCLAMAYLMADACHPGHAARPPRRPSAGGVAPAPPAVPDGLGDVFRVDAADRVGDAVVLRGELLVPPEEAFGRLEARFAGTGLAPFLQRGADGRPVVLLAPAADPPADADRPWLNVLLLGLTLAATAAAGARHAGADLWREPGRVVEGLAYAVPLLLVLGVHELGHYLAARHHRLAVSLPYFIPVPFGLGTFGAFIRMRGLPADRRALFDVAAAGPLAGLAVAVPLLWWGLGHSTAVPAAEGGTYPGSSVLLAVIAELAGPVSAGGQHLRLHPAAFAGWLGVMITALNLLPVGQLDGGHAADGLLGRAGGTLASGVALFALLFLGLFVWGGLLGWAVLAYLLAGAKGVPPRNDLSPVGPGRWAAGVFLFAVLVLALAPLPQRLADALGLRCPYL